MQFHKKAEIDGHEFLFDQLQLCGPQVPPVRGVLTERLSAQSLSGLLQLPEAGARSLPAGLSLPPPPAAPPAASRAALHAVPARGAARLGAHAPPGSRRAVRRAAGDHILGAEPPLRLGHAEPPSASFLRADGSRSERVLLSRQHAEGPGGVPVDEEGARKHRWELHVNFSASVAVVCAAASSRWSEEEE